MNTLKTYLNCFLVFMLTSILLVMMLAQASEASEDKVSGERLFRKHCSACHGSDGGGGVGVPLNLADFLSTASNQYLKKTIRLGRPGRVMPAFTRMSDHQVDAIISYIRSWNPDIKIPVYSQENIKGDVKKGQLIYDAVCFNCHREKGIGGKGTGVTFSRPRDAEILAPAIGNPAFLASASDQMIKKIILTGRETTPMISATYMGLSSKDVNNVVSYLRSLENTGQEKLFTFEKTNNAMLSFESSYSVEETIKNLKQAASGHNFRYIREQTLDHGFVDVKQEKNKQYLIYFCNFNFLNESLSVDPRIGMFLPFRASIVKKADGQVVVMTVNPDYLCSLFDNNELKQKCNFISEKFRVILEESTL